MRLFAAARSSVLLRRCVRIGPALHAMGVSPLPLMTRSLSLALLDVRQTGAARRGEDQFFRFMERQ